MTVHPQPMPCLCTVILIQPTPWFQGGLGAIRTPTLRTQLGWVQTQLLLVISDVSLDKQHDSQGPQAAHLHNEVVLVSTSYGGHQVYRLINTYIACKAHRLVSHMAHGQT